MCYRHTENILFTFIHIILKFFYYYTFVYYYKTYMHGTLEESVESNCSFKETNYVHHLLFIFHFELVYDRSQFVN